MNLIQLLRFGRFGRFGVVASAVLVLAACGGSSQNASPGSVVVEVPVYVGGDDDDDDDDGTDTGDAGDTDDGATVASVIPTALESVIADSGETAGPDFGNRPIVIIDVSETSALDRPVWFSATM